MANLRPGVGRRTRVRGRSLHRPTRTVSEQDRGEDSAALFFSSQREPGGRAWARARCPWFLAAATTVASLAADAVRLLIGLPGAEFHELDLPAAVHAAGIARELRVQAGDALYAAVALDHGCTLVTMDEELLQGAAPLVDACTPETWIARGAESRGDGRDGG